MDIEKIVERLLYLSEDICDEIDSLEDLSYRNRENSSEFETYIKNLANFLRQETIILNTMSAETLMKISNHLYNLKRSDGPYERTFVLINGKLLEKISTDEIDNDVKINPSSGYYQTYADNIRSDSIHDNENPVATLLSEYYEDTDDIEEHIPFVVHRNATIAIKKMLDRIKVTETDNKIDANYKKKLIKYFRAFKYHFFTLDQDMEKLGVQVKFDVDSLPDYYTLDGSFMNICFNQCVDLIDKLYGVNEKQRGLNIISEALFDILCFEEHIDNLDDELIDKLISLCYEYDRIVKRNFYGEMIVKKLIKKKKN